MNLLMNLAKPTGEEIGTWILGAVALFCACFYLYLTFTKNKKTKNTIVLIEFLFIVLVVIVVVWPLASAGNIWDGRFLASFGLLIYIIARLFHAIKAK